MAKGHVGWNSVLLVSRKLARVQIRILRYPRPVQKCRNNQPKFNSLVVHLSPAYTQKARQVPLSQGVVPIFHTRSKLTIQAIFCACIIFPCPPCPNAIQQHIVLSTGKVQIIQMTIQKVATAYQAGVGTRAVVMYFVI
jgi:hypothetical protein